MPSIFVKKDEGPSQQEFINDLMDKLGKQDAQKEEPKPASATEAPAAEDEHTTDAPVVEEKEEETPTTDAPAVDGGEEEGDEYEEVVELSKTEFDALLQKLDALGKRMQEQPGAAATSAVVAEAAKLGKGGSVTLSMPELKKALLSAEELDLVADEPQIINKAFERMIEAMQPAFESISRLPGAIESQINNVLSVKDTVVNFYQENPDIAGNETVQRLVKQEFDSRAAALAQAGQTINESQLLNEIADKVRKDLGWKKPKPGVAVNKKAAEAKRVTVLGDEIGAVVKKRKKAKGKPTLPGGGGGRKPAVKKAARAGEAGKIDELLSELGALS